jgi:hypothetical protein
LKSECLFYHEDYCLLGCDTMDSFCWVFSDALRIETIQHWMVRWLMNWKGFGRKLLWPNRGIIF